jgi:hypothetical protein
MSEDMKAELQHWQARTDEMQVAIERVREDEMKHATKPCYWRQLTRC